ncbi:MAG: C39 family peptidase [Proteobacteria bacterium]|nr:C39 family peptidase [Pseudomonadota bacterium]MBU1737337.1 C39 family peptidase [Pseudomonadota bacterium]
MMKRLLVTLLFLVLALPSHAAIKPSVQLNVPLVNQGKMLCGPATMEMLFRYWGVYDYDQYDIAGSLLKQFSQTERYRKSGILKTDPVDWNKYPGTGTINMREFLKRFGRTHNMMMEYEPDSSEAKVRKRDELFYKVKEYVSNGIPVVVHQYWRLPKAKGHYRVVTGYNESRREVYLNDADGGKRLVQTYDDFLKLWDVNQRWMHYNAIVFNTDRQRLNITLP